MKVTGAFTIQWDGPAGVFRALGVPDRLKLGAPLEVVPARLGERRKDWAELDAEEALAHINEIRNSIIGFQTVNWSEHVYPLVAALNAAGFEGDAYADAKDNHGTMLERTLGAERRVADLDGAVGRFLAAWDEFDGPPAAPQDTFNAVAESVEELREAAKGG